METISFLIQLKNKIKPNEKLDVFQTSQTADVQFLSDYLNSLLSLDTKYLFYYKNTRISSDLKNIIEQYKLDSEETIEIDFININDQEPDFNITYDDTPIILTSFKNIILSKFYYGKICVAFEDQIDNTTNYVSEKQTDNANDSILNKDIIDKIEFNLQNYKNTVADTFIYSCNKNTLIDLQTGSNIAIMDVEIKEIDTKNDSILELLKEIYILLIKKIDNIMILKETTIILKMTKLLKRLESK